MARRIQSVTAVFEAAIKGTLEEVQKHTAAVAHREHAKVMATDPRPGRFTQYVDGVEGAAFEAVKGGGVIFITYDRLDVVTQFAMESLFDLSPVDSGDYRNAHSLFLNGVPVANLKEWRTGDEIVIANPLPYARKIELGVMEMRVSGTDHVYQQAEAKVKGRYGNLADIRFVFRSLVAGSAVAYQPAGSANAAWSRHGGAERENRVPALLILPAGTLGSRRSRWGR